MVASRKVTPTIEAVAGGHPKIRVLYCPKGKTLAFEEVNEVLMYQ